MNARLLAAVLALAAPALGRTGQEIVDAMDKVLMFDEGAIEVSIIDRRGGTVRTTFEATALYKKDCGTLMEFTAPAREKGKKVLMVGTNMWMAVPGVSRPVRVSGKESFMGTSFSNNDLMDYSKGNDYVSTVTDSTDTSFTVEMKSASRTVSYPRIVAQVSRAYLPIRQDLYTLSGNLIKVVEFTQVKQLAGRQRPSVYTMRDVLTQGNETAVVFRSMTAKAVDESAFSPDNLTR